MLERSAVISDDGLYRYVLSRTWDPHLPVLLWVMLNPSIANHLVNDPTIVKCIGFAKRAGYGGIVVVNLFAYRATKPSDLWAANARGIDITGPDNDIWIIQEAERIVAAAGTVVLAWGANASRASGVVRAKRMLGMLWRFDPVCLGDLTIKGQPKHPLMLAYTTEWREICRGPIQDCV